MLRVPALLSALVLTTNGCQNDGDHASASGTHPGEQAFGFVEVALTDTPLDDQGITAVNVCIERVDLIYWALFGGFDVWQTRKDGTQSEPRVFATVFTPVTALVVDDVAVYWIDAGNEVYRVAK